MNNSERIKKYERKSWQNLKSVELGIIKIKMIINHKTQKNIWKAKSEDNVN